MKTVFLSAGYVSALTAHGFCLDGTEEITSLTDLLAANDLIAIESQTTRLVNLPFFSNMGLRTKSLLDNVPAFEENLIDHKLASRVFSDSDDSDEQDAWRRLNALSSVLLTDGTLVLFEGETTAEDTVVNILNALSKRQSLDAVLATPIWNNFLVTI